ncbi:histidine phosphatase family protein [Brevibacterium sp. BRM-1]|uniref:histidine phosphatase family protein n=1 Tax=Brevibacterium sp. BRM-1 TaxID=2999062 RepID=UPI00227D9D87|nr:histidine phosphatase family protein [Brevibacterium sp. BRM-1]WAL40793.1 histidine phosphatase family protein [Brevibacterium sp. BRM-1]
MVRIIAVRHGQTGANVAGVLAGRLPGVELTAAGRADVLALGRRFPVSSAAILAHSTVERCAVTSGLLLESVSAAQVRAEPAFDEVDYGAWSGRTLAELGALDEWRLVARQPSRVVFPGGEALAGAAARARAGVAALAAELRDLRAGDESGANGAPNGSGGGGGAGGAVGIVVSHGDIIKAILADALGMDLDDFQRIAVAPGSYSIIDYPDDPSVPHAHPTVAAMSVTASGTAGSAQLGGGDGA